MRRSAIPVAAVAFALCAGIAPAALAATGHKRLPSPAGTPSPLNAYRDRPTVSSTTRARGAAVPAYGINLDPIDGNTFVFLDAANPGELNVIAPTSHTFVGGAFVGNDFSRFYVIDADTAELYWLDTSDGSENLIGSTDGGFGETWTGMGTDPTNGILFGVTADLTGDNPFLHALHDRHGDRNPRRSSAPLERAASSISPLRRAHLREAPAGHSSRSTR